MPVLKVLIADDHEIVVLGAQILDPHRLGGATKVPGHAPGPRERMIDQCHLVMQEVWIGRVQVFIQAHKRHLALSPSYETFPV